MNRALIEERVERGVEWLDEHVPDWLDRVVVQDLDLYESCKCVLGQVFEAENERERAGSAWSLAQEDGYHYALHRYLSLEVSHDYGFDFSAEDFGKPTEWKLLTEVWREKISYLKRQRRGDRVLLTRLLAECFEPLTLEEELYVLEEAL